MPVWRSPSKSLPLNQGARESYPEDSCHLEKAFKADAKRLHSTRRFARDVPSGSVALVKTSPLDWHSLTVII